MLSDFSRGILKVLRKAQQPLSADEITKRLSEKDGRKYSESNVSTYLLYGLRDYTRQTMEGNWTAADLNDNEISSPNSETDASQHYRKIDTRSIEFRGLNEAIVDALSQSDTPLKAREIAQRISTETRLISQTKINGKLYGDLSDYVERDSQYRWSIEKDNLADSSRGEKAAKSEAIRTAEPLDKDENVPYSEEDIIAAVGKMLQGPARPMTTDDLSAKLYADGIDIPPSELQRILENHHDKVYYTPQLGWHAWSQTEIARADQKNRLEKYESILKKDASAKKIAAAVNSQLDIAKSLVTVLGLTSSPLSIRSLTIVLQNLGYDVEPDKVEACLDSVLDEFVSKSDLGQYSLAEESGTASISDEDSVDEDTRATLSGSIYSYEFVEADIESPALMASEVCAGTVRIKLNASHPLFRYVKLLTGVSGTGNDESGKLAFALRILFASWVDMESDLQGTHRDRVEDLRVDWGRSARFLIRKHENT